MNLVVHKFVCENGHAFEAPDSSGAYGEFVVRSRSSVAPGLLRALEDPVYAEVDGILERLGAYRGKDHRKIADTLRAVFGASCDRAPDGNVLEVGRRAPCPRCGTSEMYSWEPVRPYCGPVTPIGHERWSKLTLGEKERLLEAALAAI